MVAARLANMPAHRPNNIANLQSSSLEESAELLNVSKRSVSAAKKVQENDLHQLM
jgi:hypothetical protein